MDESVDAPVPGCDVTDDCGALFFGGDVEREEGGQFLALLRATVGTYDEGPFGCECVDDCIADSAA